MLKPSIVDKRVGSWGIEGVGSWVIEGVDSWGIEGVDSWGIEGVDSWGIEGVDSWVIKRVGGNGELENSTPLGDPVEELGARFMGELG
ncbi:MAG: hypothetical protein ISQ13_02910 [Candidatus Margulisbacteria bacterium]|nr:hypothetical protein [Candidatus Margulisiibacteriota bacterium]